MKLMSVLILSMILFISCGSSKTANREKIAVSPYSTIVSSSGIEVYYSQGKSHTADIDKYDNVNVNVKDGSLILSRKGGRKGNAKVYLSASKLDAVILSGGSRFFSEELKNSDKISITASGGANIDINKVKSDNCNVALSGGADCTIRQTKSEKINIAASGGSNTNIRIEKAKNANVAASGGSNITVSGRVDNISVSASGSADVNVVNLKYDNINTNMSGRGSIRK